MRIVVFEEGVFHLRIPFSLSGVNKGGRRGCHLRIPSLDMYT